MIRPLDSQYPGTARSESRYVVAGLDFGTSFTKLVIADTANSYAVPLRSAAVGLERYLLPGLLRRRTDNCYALADDPFKAGVCENLKLSLIDRPQDLKVFANVAGFLALVLQKGRTAFLKQYRDIFGRDRLDWHLNIGVPAGNIEDQDLVRTFRVLAEAAWTLSISTTQPNPAMAWLVVNDAMTGVLREKGRYRSIADHLLEPEQVWAIPEVVAETVSYAHSSMRQDGLHLLIDIGAGTLDLNVFKLFRHEDDNRYSLFVPKVLPLGSRYLADHRRQRLTERLPATLNLLERLLNEYEAIPTRTDLESALELEPGTIAELDSGFLNEVGSQVYRALNEAHKGWANQLHNWTRPITALVAGGGSEDQAYQERIKKVSKDMVTNGMLHGPKYGLMQRRLPMPERFQGEGISDVEFHRLAVAYGLAQDPINLGDFIPPTQLPRPVRAVAFDGYRDRYPGPEQM